MGGEKGNLKKGGGGVQKGSNIANRRVEKKKDPNPHRGKQEKSDSEEEKYGAQYKREGKTMQTGGGTRVRFLIT